MRIVQLDPDTSRRIQALMASFGKTWLQGKVIAIKETRITLTGALDNAPHTVVADENTQFRRRRDPITLADIQAGDTVRVEGAPSGGAFVATAVELMGGAPANGPSAPPYAAPPPPSAPPQ